MELPFTELFGSPSPVYNEDLAEDSGDEDGEIAFTPSSSGEMVNTDWEWMQEYGDISDALENCPGIYERCVNINDICCKTERQLLSGPTLAELNERRALSPLINPDMKRLHLVATKRDSGEKLLKFEENHSRLPNRSCLMEINHPIPRKYNSAPESVGSLSHVKSENVPASVRRMLICGVNRPSALNSFAGLEKNKDATKIAEIGEMSMVENASLETEGSDDVKRKNIAQSETETLSESSDREMETVDDDDISSGSDDEDDEDDEEATPSKLFRSSRKRKRSEAEDMTPNPRKLKDIGKQLDRLNRVINGLRPMDQSSVNAKNKTRREKNKLASRLVPPFHAEAFQRAFLHNLSRGRGIHFLIARCKQFHHVAIIIFS